MINNKLTIILLALVFLCTSTVSKEANANIFSVIAKQLDNYLSITNKIRIGDHSYRVYDRYQKNCNENSLCNNKNRKYLKKFSKDEKNKIKINILGEN